MKGHWPRACGVQDIKSVFAVRGTSENKKISLEQTFKFLDTSGDGLSESEAEKRLGRFG